MILVLNSHNFVRCHCSTLLYGYCNWDLSRRQAYFLVQTIVTVSHFCAGVRVVCKLISDLSTFSPLNPIYHPCIFHEIINLVSDNTCM